jgi:polyisoprenoid-binding protein YceI
MPTKNPKGSCGPPLCTGGRMLLTADAGGVSGAAARAAPRWRGPSTRHRARSIGRWTQLYIEVHGTFRLKSGRIVFDPATGNASGALVVDATSGESGNESRDKRMHTSIIESRKYTEIVFTPGRVEGSLAPQGSSTVQVHGKFRLMNVDHELKRAGDGRSASRPDCRQDEIQRAVH